MHEFPALALQVVQRDVQAAAAQHHPAKRIEHLVRPARGVVLADLLEIRREDVRLAKVLREVFPVHALHQDAHPEWIAEAAREIRGLPTYVVPVKLWAKPQVGIVSVAPPCLGALLISQGADPDVGRLIAFGPSGRGSF